MENKKSYQEQAMVKTIAICWLVFITAFILAVLVMITKKWPYPIINKIELYISGHSEEQTSLVDKLKNDLDITPERHLVQAYDYKASPRDYEEVKGLPLNPRRENPKIYLSKNAPKGYRLLFGVFDFKESLHGVILLDSKGNVEHVWQTSQESVNWDHRADKNVFPHGLEVAPDGSIVTAYDNGNSLTKYDYCGNIVWRIKGGFHHSIEFEGGSAIWTWGNPGSKWPYGDYLVKIDYNSGEVLKKFHLKEVMEANPDIDIFGILQKDTAEGSQWISDEAGGRWHANDIDPLPEHLTKYYPDFKEGDLLVSLRAPDLIFVLDPETYKVKWWRQGLARRPHDPDWNYEGTITIYNNNMHRGYSSIIELDPVNYKYEHVVKGKNYDFYSWMQGKHQRFPNGGYLITSSQQGRVFELNKEGQVTFEFINFYGRNKASLAISEAMFLPEDYFKGLPTCE